MDFIERIGTFLMADPKRIVLLIGICIVVIVLASMIKGAGKLLIFLIALVAVIFIVFGSLDNFVSSLDSLWNEVNQLKEIIPDATYFS